MQATALVEACVQGHSSCVKALLEAGAKPHSKWQGLSPIQWANKQGNGDCVDECRGGGGRLRPLPIGTRSVSHEENSLLPPPLRDARPIPAAQAAVSPRSVSLRRIGRRGCWVAHLRCPSTAWLLLTYNLLLTTYYSLLTTCYLPLTTHTSHPSPSP